MRNSVDVVDIYRAAETRSRLKMQNFTIGEYWSRGVFQRQNGTTV
jgi:hypothetical protein